MRVTRLEFYESANCQGGPQWWRWRVKAGNGRIIGASSEGYARKIDARRNAKQLAAVVAALLALGACASQPVTRPLAPFERCMESVGKSQYYTSDKILAAQWCRDNSNGGIL